MDTGINKITRAKKFIYSKEVAQDGKASNNHTCKKEPPYCEA